MFAQNVVLSLKLATAGQRISTAVKEFVIEEMIVLLKKTANITSSTAAGARDVIIPLLHTADPKQMA